MAAATPPANPTAPETPTPDAQVNALEQRIDQLTQTIQARGDADGQLSQVIANLQAQVEKLSGGDPTQGRQPSAEPTEKFQQFYSDIDGYIKKAAIEANREVLGPHLANQALQTRDAMLAQAKNGVDTEYGEGTWDEHLAKQVNDTLGKLPLEMQSSRQHFEAAISAVLGKMYLEPSEAKKLEDRRAKNSKAKEDAMNMLPPGRGRPTKADKPDERELTFLDSLDRSGFTVTKDEYQAAKGIKTIDDWRAAHPPAKK